MKHKYKQLLTDVKIAYHQWWGEKHIQSLKTCYGKAPFFPHYRTFFEELYSVTWESLNQLNEQMLRFFISNFGITTRIVRSGELKLKKTNGDIRGTDRLILLAKELGADAYLAGACGMEAYLDVRKIEEAGIQVLVQTWKCPNYRQQFPEIGFYEDLSIVDLMFNERPNSFNILF